MHSTHPLNILDKINKEVFQHLHQNGITFEFAVENYYSDMTLKYSIDFLHGTERGAIMLDKEGKRELKNRICVAFMNEPERYPTPTSVSVMF